MSLLLVVPLPGGVSVKVVKVQPTSVFASFFPYKSCGTANYITED